MADIFTKKGERRHGCPVTHEHDKSFANPLVGVVFTLESATYLACKNSSFNAVAKAAKRSPVLLRILDQIGGT